MRVDWLPDVLRDAGCDVAVMPGALTRGFEMARVDAVIGHHTATSTAWLDGHVAALLRDGRRDLAGPLSQLGLERSGTFVVVATGLANHNGYGTYRNQSIGIEAYNSGIGERWPTVQVEAYQLGTAAILKHVGLPSSRFLGHRESDPKRKIDPTGLDMDMMRKVVSKIMSGTITLPPTAQPSEEDEPMPTIVTAPGRPPRVWDGSIFVPLDDESLYTGGAIMKQWRVSAKVYDDIRDQVIRALDETS